MTTPLFRPGPSPLKDNEHTPSGVSSPNADARAPLKTSGATSAVGAAGSSTGQKPPTMPVKTAVNPAFGAATRPPSAPPLASGSQTTSLLNKPASSPCGRCASFPASPLRAASPVEGARRVSAPVSTGAAAWPGNAPRPSSLLKTSANAAGTPSPAAPSAMPRPAATAASPFRKDLQVSDDEFVHLRDFIYQQCGIFIAENRKYLIENRLSSRIKDLNLKSYSEYYNFLRFDASRKAELTKLFEVVTTNETSFYRNPPQLEVFQNVVLADIVEKCRKAGNKRLRLWSAGCSTGEEPYTLAIILHEVLKGDIASWDIKITANDLSDAVLNAARRGIYNEYALRTTPPGIVSAYFTKDGNIYKINESLKRLVSFGQINLNDKEQLRRVERSQIVFCRNVIIYFDDDMKRRVINAYYDNLEPGGVLLIGHSESLHNISRAFQLEQHRGTIVYRKT